MTGTKKKNRGGRGKEKEEEKERKKKKRREKKKKWVCDSVCVISKEENKHQLLNVLEKESLRGIPVGFVVSEVSLVF
jgi:hypothetical protein